MHTGTVGLGYRIPGSASGQALTLPAWCHGAVDEADADTVAQHLRGALGREPTWQQVRGALIRLARARQAEQAARDAIGTVISEEQVDDIRSWIHGTGYTDALIAKIAQGVVRWLASEALRESLDAKDGSAAQKRLAFTSQWLDGRVGETP